MSVRRLVPALLPALLAASLGAPGRAQNSAAPCRLCSADSAASQAARSNTPLRLEVQGRLEFDKIVFGGLGEAQVALSPSGTATISGATSASGARAMPGSVLIRGEPGRAVRIDLPRQVQLFGEGSGSIRIERLVTDLPDFPLIGTDGTLSFRFGGDLRVSGDGDGAYRGSIDILVENL